MRITSKVATALLAAAALTACSSGTSSTTDQGTTGEDMTFAMWIGGQEDQKSWGDIAATSAEKGGPTLTIQGAPWSDYWTKLQTQLTANDAPCVVGMNSTRMGAYVDGLAPLSDLGDVNLEDFDPTIIEAFQRDGEQYALPYDTGPIIFFYNEDLFTAAGAEVPQPGWTTDDFMAAAEKLKAAGTPILAPSAEDMYMESLILNYNGGRIRTPEHELELDNAKFAEGLDWMASLVKDGYAIEVLGADPANDDNQFLAGTVAGIVDGPWSVISYRDKAQFKMGITTVPKGPEGAGVWSAGSGFAVSKNCADQAGATKAVTILTDLENLTSLGEVGRAFPARLDAQDAWVQNTELEGAGDVMELAQEESQFMPSHPASNQLQQLYAQYLQQAINGQVPSAEVMSQIASQIG